MKKLTCNWQMFISCEFFTKNPQIDDTTCPEIKPGLRALLTNHSSRVKSRVSELSLQELEHKVQPDIASNVRQKFTSIKFASKKNVTLILTH